VFTRFAVSSRPLASQAQVYDGFRTRSRCSACADHPQTKQSQTAICHFTAGVCCTASGSTPLLLAHVSALTFATFLVGVAEDQSAVFATSKCVRFHPTDLHSTRELCFCRVESDAFSRDMRNNQDIRDTNSPANDLDLTKQPEGSR
jgi:hypothetical protein